MNGRAVTLRAFETDNGPGGISWEVERRGRWLASFPSLEAVRSRYPDSPRMVYTLDAWYAAHDRNGDAPWSLPATWVEFGPVLP